MFTIKTNTKLRKAQENFWFSLAFPSFSSIFHYLCKVCGKNSRFLFEKLKIFFEKLKDFGEKTQRNGSKSLHLAPKKVVNKKACINKENRQKAYKYICIKLVNVLTC